MKKKLDIAAISNELEGASVFFAQSRSQAANRSTDQSISRSISQPADQSSNQSTNSPNGQLIDQEKSQSVNRKSDKSTERQANQSIQSLTNKAIDNSIILGKPKAFYISAKQDAELDMAVKSVSALLGGKVNQKIDRSTIVRLLLEEADLSSKKTADRLANRLVNRLISQLTSQSTA